MGNCGSILTKPCLSESDNRYDANYPQTIIGQDPRWEKLSGFFKVNVTSFDPDTGYTQPGPYIQGVPQTLDRPFRQDRFIVFYNHTVKGSRLIGNRYYFKSPADAGFCNIPFAPPKANAVPGSECGVNGNVDFAGVYASLNHEHDGTLSIARTTGNYAPPGEVFNTDPGSMVKLIDDSTFEFTFVAKDFYSIVQSFVFFDDDTSSLSVVSTYHPGKKITETFTAQMVRLTEEEFLAGIEEYNTAFAVPEPIEAPMISDEVQKYTDTFPTEEEWCGGLVKDISCTPSPYKEPATQLKDGFIALFAILGILVVGIGGFLLHRNSANNQKKRYKEHFIRGIARNITIADSAGRVNPEQLKKEFDLIDKDGGGTISKDELTEFLKSGKVGDISDKDIVAMWTAIDIDNSGEVDFVEFISFLGSCGTEFETANKEQKIMTKDEKLKYASQRLSMRALSVPKYDKGECADNGAEVKA